MPFTPVETSLGALLLSISSTLLHHTTSQILGCSSALSSLLSSPTPVLVGLLASGPLSALILPQEVLPIYPPPQNAAVGLLAPFLVGLGTRWASGCTSGHMLCGLARLSERSLVAVGSFMATAMLTVRVFSTTPACPTGACYLPTYPSVTTAAHLVGVVVGASAGAYAISRMKESETARMTARLYSGLVFGLGLVISGLARPEKTLQFLQLWGERFDPSLLVVAALGLGGNMLLWRKREREGKPIFVDEWKLPRTKGGVNGRLVVGAAVFGVGWGLGGVCPGPGLVKGTLDGLRGLMWLGAFLAGSKVGEVVAW